MNYYVNENIRKTERVFPMQGRMDYLRYDMNENPEGLPKAFVDSVLSEITPEFLAVYPEPDRFVGKYADFVGAKPENIMTANGSDMAIRYILETFGEPGKDVVTVTPSFEMYRINCSLLGLRHVPVPYNEDLTISVDRILEAITEDTRIVVLLNPNNPVGNVYTEEELRRIIEKTRETGSIVLIDEAYHYFWPETFLPYALSEENVIVLRTFSKLFSLAALRLGIVIAHPDLIHYIKNGRLSFDVNSAALLFAERILDHPEMVETLQETEREGKEWILSELSARGYWCRDCRGNFIFVRPKAPASAVVKRLEEEEKLLVHGYGHPYLKDLIRVSVGSRRAMEIFLPAFLRADRV